MKKLFEIAIVFFAVLSSCNSNPKTENNLAGGTSDQSDFSLLADSISIRFNEFLKSANQVNAETLIAQFSRSPELKVINWDGGLINNTDSLYELMKHYYTPLAYQDIKGHKPGIKVLSPSHATVVYNGEFTSRGKDSSSIGGTFGWTILYVREQGQWKILNMQQSIKWRGEQPK